MRGAKPKLKNVVPFKGGDPAAGEDLKKAAIRRAVVKLQPAGLDKEMQREWRRVAGMLAEPTVDRLKPRFVDVILEYCRVTIRLRTLRGAFQTVGDEVRELGGRHGAQLKSHPHVAQINEAWRQWRSLVAMLGLSPTDERNLIPGQGDLFDESEKYFAG